MALSSALRAGACVLLLCAPLMAQAPPSLDDPFGPAESDPFAEVKQPQPPGPAVRDGGVKATAKQVGSSHPAKTRPDGLSSNDRIRATLDDATAFSFVELPLQEAARFIGEQHDIPVILNRRALEEIGIDTDAPITLSLQNVSLRSALRLMLRDLELTYMIQDQVLQITTPEHAEGHLEVRIYKLSKILAGQSDQVVKAMQTTVRTDMWDIAGGPCAAALVDHVIVVSGTETLHESVADFLRELEKSLE